MGKKATAKKPAATKDNPDHFSPEQSLSAVHINKQVHALQEKFRAANARFPLVPVYIVPADTAVDEDDYTTVGNPRGGSAMYISSDVPEAAVKTLEQLSQEALYIMPASQRGFVGDPHTAAGKWLFFVAAIARSHHHGEWVAQPVDADNPEEFTPLGGNPFFLSAQVLFNFLRPVGLKPQRRCHNPRHMMVGHMLRSGPNVR